MANIAELQASIKIKTEEAERNVKRLNTTLEALNKKVTEGKALTREEERLRKQLNSVINTEIKARNSAVRELEKQIKAQEKVDKALERTNKQKEKSNGLWSALATRITVAGLAVNAITGLFNKLTGAIKESYTEALKFQQNMSLVNTIANLSKNGINDLSKEIANMGTQLGKAPSEMAMGLYDINSSVDDSIDKMALLETATKASKAGYTDVATAVRTGTALLNAYGLGNEDITKIYDMQFKTVEYGVTTYGEFSQALGNIIASAKKAKVPMNEMLGQFALLTRKGLDSSEATTALARAYDGIYEKGEKFKEILNIDVADQNGKLKSTTEIIGELGVKLSEFDEISQINILEKLGFEVRAGKAIELISTNLQETKFYIDEIAKSSGVTEEAFKKATDNILTESERTKAVWASWLNDIIIKNERLIVSFEKVKQAIPSMLSKIKEFFSFGGFLTPSTSENFDKWAKQSQDLNKALGITEKQVISTKKAIEGLSKADTGFSTFTTNMEDYFTKTADGSTTMASTMIENAIKILRAYEQMAKSMPTAALVTPMIQELKKLGIKDNVLNQIAGEFVKTGKATEGIKALENLKGSLPKKTFGTGGSGDKENTGITWQELREQVAEQVRVAKELAEIQGTSKIELAKTLSGIYSKGTEQAIGIKAPETSAMFNTQYKYYEGLLKEAEIKEKLEKFNESYFKSLEESLDVLTKEEKDILKSGTYNMEDVKKDQELINQLIEEDKKKDLEDTIKKYEDYSNKLSATSDLISQLGGALENDLISALGSTINQISSITRLAGQINTGQIGGLIGGLGIAGAVVGILSQVGSFNNIKESELQQEAVNKFNESVEKFKQTIDSFSIAQKINFAKMQAPTNLQFGAYSGGKEGITFKDTLKPFGIGPVNQLKSLFGGGKATNANVDTSAIKNALSGTMYGNIDVDAVMAKYAQHSTYRNWYGKEKSYISGYDTAGAMEEINRLMKEAYRINLDSFKEAVGVSADSFSSAMKEALEGGDVDTIVEDLFTNALKTAFINQEAFANVFSAMGDTMSEAIFSKLGVVGKTKEELAKMSLEEQKAYLKQMLSGYDDVLKSLGLSADNASNSLNSLSDSVKTNNLPSVLKLAVLENQSSKGYNSGTNYYIQSVYGSVDGQFRNMVNKSVANDTTKRTGN